MSCGIEADETEKRIKREKAKTGKRWMMCVCRVVVRTLKAGIGEIQQGILIVCVFFFNNQKK